MNYLTRLLLITAITFATTLKATAQIDSLIYNTDNPTIVADERYELRLNVDGMAFFRDNEYNTKDAVKGYTLPGVWLQPSVSYQPLRNLKLELGAVHDTLLGSQPLP